MPARRRFVQICVGFIGIAFIGLVAHFALKFTYREARIAHQPVTHWLELLSSDNEQDRTNAQRALRSELAPTMEYVFKELDAIEARDYHEGVVKNLSLLLSGSSIEQERGQRRWTAFTLLDGLGPLATNAIPRAVDWLKDDRLDGIAIDILASIGEPAEPVVLNLLENPNQDLRRKAVRALSHFKPTSDRILGAIIESTMDKDARIQTAAIGALWLSDAPPEVKGRILGDLLSDPSPMVYDAALYKLDDYGPVTPVALPALRKAARSHPDEKFRSRVASLLRLWEPRLKADG